MNLNQITDIIYNGTFFSEKIWGETNIYIYRDQADLTNIQDFKIFNCNYAIIGPVSVSQVWIGVGIFVGDGGFEFIDVKPVFGLAKFVNESIL